MKSILKIPSSSSVLSAPLWFVKKSDAFGGLRLRTVGILQAVACFFFKCDTPAEPHREGINLSVEN